jgi:hypothetical protein
MAAAAINTGAKPRKTVSLSYGRLRELHTLLEELEDAEADEIKLAVDKVIEELLNSRLNTERPLKESDSRPIVNLLSYKYTLTKVTKRRQMMEIRNSVLREVGQMLEAAQAGGRRRSRTRRRTSRKNRHTSRR